MLNLRGIISQLSKDDVKGIARKLHETKAKKFGVLLEGYRDINTNDEEILAELKVSNNAFYVLKSRLFEKIQEYLLENQSGPKTDMFKKLVAIPNLVFNTERDIAIAILTKLEKDLLDNDMPYELTSVYSALKKLHLNTPKYFEYTQQYNKHVAYTLAIDKAADLLSSFVTHLGKYHASKDESILEVVQLLKNEIANLARLYESHHLKVHKNILDASVAIFLPLSNEVMNDDPIEDILKQTEEIIKQFPKDSFYRYILNVLNFLYFSYYHKLGLFKKADQYYILVNICLPSFLYYSHCCFSSLFLVFKLERCVKMGTTKYLEQDNKEIFKKYNPEPGNIPSYTNYVKYMAASLYYSGKMGGATKLLSNLLNDISFKGYAHAEIEIKFFLALTYSLQNKYELAWNVLRNTIRKVRELNDDGLYENALIFGTMLKLQTSSKEDMKVKLIQLGTKFTLHNNGTTRMLEFIGMDDAFFTLLAKPIKPQLSPEVLSSSN